MMRSRRGLGTLGAVALAATLAACGSAGYSGSSSPSATSSGAATSAAGGATSTATLSVDKTSLGSVVAGPDGRTVYQYDKDTRGAGKSSCTGPCAAAWPAVTTAGTPKAPGVTGEIGTLTMADGKKQVTLNGWPLYYYAGDGSAGDVNGQGIQDIWWAVSGTGAKITRRAAPSSAVSGGKGGYGSY